MKKIRHLFLLMFLIAGVFMLGKGTAYAGQIGANASRSPVQSNKSAGDLPVGISCAAPGETIYFNVHVTNDVYIKTASLKIYKNGSLWHTYSTTANNYLRYTWEDMVVSSGKYTWEWTLVYTNGASDKIGNASALYVPEITGSVSEVKLDLYNKQTASFGAELKYFNSAMLLRTTLNSEIVELNKQRSGGTTTYNVKAKQTGSTTLQVRLVDKNNVNKVYAEKTFRITVTDSTPVYTVSYNANGGSGAPSYQNKRYGQALTLSSIKPYRTGYDFLGWAKSSSGSVSYQPGNTYNVNSSVTLYAVWKKQPVSQTIKVNSEFICSYARNSTFRLSATANTELSYSSSNTEVVSVSKYGVVTIHNCGIAKITITAKADSSYKVASKTVKIKIIPATIEQTSVSSPSAGQIKVTWKIDNQATGYEIEYKKSSVASYARARIQNVDTCSLVLKNLPENTTYSVRVRSINAKWSEIIYGDWSKDASIKTKAKVKQTISGTAKVVKNYKNGAKFSLGQSAKGKLSYKISNTNIATVNASGEVTMKKAGTAEITVTAAATANYLKATKKVTIVLRNTAEAAKNAYKTVLNNKSKFYTVPHLVWDTSSNNYTSLRRFNYSKVMDINGDGVPELLLSDYKKVGANESNTLIMTYYNNKVVPLIWVTGLSGARFGVYVDKKMLIFEESGSKDYCRHVYSIKLGKIEVKQIMIRDYNNYYLNDKKVSKTGAWDKALKAYNLKSKIGF